MIISYWDCKYEDYEEYWDGENEERVYGCLHPDKCGVCGVDNKWGSEKSECPIAEFERKVK